MRLDRTNTSFVGRWWWTVDRPNLYALLLLIVVGSILVTAGSPPVARRLDLPQFYFVHRHQVFLVLGLLVMLAASMLPPVAIRRLSVLGFVGSLGLMLLVPVIGTVTFAGDRPPAGGTVSFLPVSEDGPRRPALGTFDAQGVLRVTSFTEGDGLLPGTYRIEMRCISSVPRGGAAEGDPHQSTVIVDHVPEDFSPPPLVVPRGGRVICAIDVPAKPGRN